MADKQERTATLSDGSTLTFMRPGNVTLDELEHETQQENADRNAARASSTNMTPEQFAAVGRAHMEATQAERKRIRGLEPAERRKARVESLLASLSHRLVVSKCAGSWSCVKQCTKEGLQYVARDLLEEAAEKIIESHFARGKDHAGN